MKQWIMIFSISVLTVTIIACGPAVGRAIGDAEVDVDATLAEIEPETEAEKVIFSETHEVERIGKGIQGFTHGEGEFIGMLKLSRAGAKLFRIHFHNAKKRFTQKPFQSASVFEKAYITDIIQEMVDSGVAVHCTLIQRGWKEIDTVEDYEKVRPTNASQSAYTGHPRRLQSQPNRGRTLR